MEQRQRGPCVCPVFPIGTPTSDRSFGSPTESVVRLMQGAPGLAFPPYFQVEQLSQVMAQRGDECGVLPKRTVARTAETIHAAVWAPLHLHAALELFQGFERNLQRMPV